MMIAMPKIKPGKRKMTATHEVAADANRSKKQKKLQKPLHRRLFRSSSSCSVVRSESDEDMECEWGEHSLSDPEHVDDDIISEHASPDDGDLSDMVDTDHGVQAGPMRDVEWSDLSASEDVDGDRDGDLVSTRGRESDEDDDSTRESPPLTMKRQQPPPLRGSIALCLRPRTPPR